MSWVSKLPSMLRVQGGPDSRVGRSEGRVRAASRWAKTAVLCDVCVMVNRATSLFATMEAQITCLLLGVGQACDLSRENGRGPPIASSVLVRGSESVSAFQSLPCPMKKTDAFEGDQKASPDVGRTLSLFAWYSALL